MTVSSNCEKHRRRLDAVPRFVAGPAQGDDPAWGRLQVWLIGSSACLCVATLIVSCYALGFGKTAAVGAGWPVAVAALGIVWLSRIVHGRRVILLVFIVGYMTIPTALAGESIVWKVASYALFTGGQVWNLMALWGEKPHDQAARPSATRPNEFAVLGS